MEKYLKPRMAIVEVRHEETYEEAWLRHLAKHPEDANVHIRVFNRSYCKNGNNTGLNSGI